MAVNISFVQKAFPVPQALILSNVSLEISDGALRFFEVSRSRGILEPHVAGVLPFPKIRIGAAYDGTIREEAVSALKKLAHEKGFSNVRVLVHEDESYVFKLTLPTTDERVFRAAIEASLEENVPIPPEDALFEYDVVKIDRTRGETLVFVSVLSRQIVSGYIDLLKEGGLTPVAFETESRSLARALIPNGDTGTSVVLALRPHHTIAFVVESGKVSFSSSIGVGSADIDQAVAKTLKMSTEDARKRILEKAFRDDSNDTTLFESMLPVFSTIRDELGKVVAYHKAQSRKEGMGGDISKVILCGSDSLISGFAKYISPGQGLPIMTGSVWTNVLSPDKDIPDLDYRHSLDYGSLIGTLIS